MQHLQTLTGVAAVLVVCALLFVEECGVPMPLSPGDMVLITAGSTAAMHATRLWVVIPLAFGACLLGAITCHTVSRRAGRPMVLRAGRRVGLTPERLLTAEARLQRAGGRAVFGARILPGMRVYASIASGCLGLPLRTFVRGLVPGLALWLSACTMLGYVLGGGVTVVLRWWDRAMALTVTVVAVVIVVRWLAGRTPGPGARRVGGAPRRLRQCPGNARRRPRGALGHLIR